MREGVRDEGRGKGNSGVRTWREMKGGEVRGGGGIRS